MEAATAAAAAAAAFSSLDQSISPYKQQIRNSKNKNRSHTAPPLQKFSPSKLTTIQDGVLHAPPPSLSFSSYSPHSVQQQSPLLPIPKHYSSNSRSRDLSCPPINRKINNRTRDHKSLTPKKSNPSVLSPKISVTKGEMKMKSTTMTMISAECMLIESTNRLGPDPKDLPKDVSRVLSSSPSGIIPDLEEFSGSVFTLSPPPSSLPLPTFSLRPTTMLRCKAEVAGIDAGATDNLRRLLRLC